MKSKITIKLILYFIIIIFLNSIITGGLFVYLSQRNYIESYKEDLIRRADNISSSISKNMDILTPKDETSSNPIIRRGMGQNSMKGMRNVSPRYIGWMNEVLDSNIWIINKDARVFQRADSNAEISYENLSDDEKNVIDEAFEGKTVTTESFDNIFEDGFVSVAAPLRNGNSDVYGAILIHENISFLERFMNSAIYILIISTIVGIILAFILVVIFANKFISPIKKLGGVAKEMIRGDYTVKTLISQDDEIGELANNIDELSTRLEKSRIESANLDSMRNDFMSNISHELKTPVTVIKSSLEALVAGIIKDEELGEYHKVLYEEIGVLERLVGDLMELNSIKNVNFPMNFNEEDLISIIKDAARSQRILAEEKNIDIVLELDDSYHMMNCDYTRIRQMFITVINNAIKYSTSFGKVIITEYKTTEDIIIRIKNRGKIIEEKDIEKMFLSFYRIKDTAEKGFGLGLAIAKEIANRHNIDIEVKSTEAEGTVVEFRIPINN
jgi:signal transduction histidine kinase